MAINERSFQLLENDSRGAHRKSDTASVDEYNDEDGGRDHTIQHYRISEANTPDTKLTRRTVDEAFTLPDIQKSTNGLDEPAELINEYLRICWKRKFLVISMAIIIPLVAAVVLFSMKSAYRATGTLLVQPESVDLGNIRDVFSRPAAHLYFKTQSTILTSRELAERVIKNLNLFDHSMFQEAEPDPQGEAQRLSAFERWYQGFYDPLQLPDWLPLDKWLPGLRPAPVDVDSSVTTMNDKIDIFLKRLNVELLNNSQIFRISFEANDPQLAADVVNTLMQNYVGLDRERWQQNEKATHQRLNDQLDAASEKLKQAEQALQLYREREGLVDVQGVRSLAASRLAALDAQFLESSRTLDKAERLYEQAKNFSWQNVTAGSALPLGLRGDELLDDLIAQQAALREGLHELRLLYTDFHPEIRAQQDKLRSLNSVIESRIETLTAQLQQDIDEARKNKYSTNQLLQAAKAEMVSINRKEFGLNEFQREVDSSRELVDKLNNRLKESQAASDVSAAKTSIVDSATRPSAPFKPQRGKMLMAAIGAGLVFGVLIAILVEYLDRTVKTVEDIETKINIPLLGFLPLIRRRFFQNKNVSRDYFRNDPKSGFAEAVRSLRTNVLLSCFDSAAKVIVVTSSCEGEGKTSVSVNLAGALAENGKVLLIDADLRKPEIASVLGIESKSNGLSHYAAGFCSKAECIYRLDDSQLSVMPAGVAPPNPLSLLSSDRFKALLSALVKEYNYIIVDSPPLSAVSDTLVLSTYASGIILVVRANKTPYKVVLNSVNQLDRIRAPLIGAVLNASKEFGKKAYGYGYGYGYGH